MHVFAIVWDCRTRKYRVKKAVVTGQTDVAWTRPGPIAMWLSKSRAFRRKRDALRVLTDLTPVA